MPWGNAFHFDNDSTSIHDSTSHEHTRRKQNRKLEVEPSVPPQAQAEPWLQHRREKLVFKSAGQGQRAVWPGTNVLLRFMILLRWFLLREQSMPMPPCPYFRSDSSSRIASPRSWPSSIRRLPLGSLSAMAMLL